MIREMDQTSRNGTPAETSSPDAPILGLVHDAGEPALPGGFGSAFGSERYRSLHVLLPEDEDEEAAAAGGTADDDVGGIEARLAGILSQSDEVTMGPDGAYEAPLTPGRADESLFPSDDRARLDSLDGAEYAGEHEDAPLQASPHPMMMWPHEGGLETLPEESGEAETPESSHGHEALVSVADKEMAEIEARAAADDEEEAARAQEQSYRDWEESEKAKYMANYRHFLRSRSNTPTSSDARGSVFRDTVSDLADLEVEGQAAMEQLLSHLLVSFLLVSIPGSSCCLVCCIIRRCGLSCMSSHC